MRERASAEAFADAAGAGDEDVQVLADPGEVTHLRELARIGYARGAGIEVFEGGALWQPGPKQALRQTAMKCRSPFF